MTKQPDKNANTAPVNNDQPVKYDWNQPHYFNKSQMTKIHRFVDLAAKTITTSFRLLCKTDLNVYTDRVTQVFARQINDIAENSRTEQSNDYYLVLSSHDSICGLLHIPLQTALFWTSVLLGDIVKPSEQKKTLSPLEISLLFDSSIRAINALNETHQQLNLQAHLKLEQSLNFELSPIDEVCKITYNNQVHQHEIGPVHFYILSSILNPVAQKQPPQSPPKEEIEKMILSKLEKIPVNLTAQLGHIKIKFEDLMQIQPDDILVTDKQIGCPVTINMKNKTILKGQPAQSEGNLAIVITD